MTDMTTHNYRWGRALVGTAAGAALAAGTLVAPGAAVADEHTEDCGLGVPASMISIQLFSLRGLVGEVGIEQVLADLAEIGYENIAPFGGTYQGMSAEEFRALADSYGLEVSSSHSSTNPDNFDQTLDFALTLGQEYLGSGGWPAPGPTGSYEDAVATAEQMNAFGRQSVAAGLGKYFGHNHDREFLTTFTDPETGEEVSAFEVIVDNIDPSVATTQLDVFWAREAGMDPVEVIEELGDRIELYHIKDGVFTEEGAEFRNVGQGEIDWKSVFEAIDSRASYYVIENDRPTDGIDFAAESFDYLRCLDYDTAVQDHLNAYLTEVQEYAEADRLHPGVAAQIRAGVNRVEHWVEQGRYDKVAWELRKQTRTLEQNRRLVPDDEVWSYLVEQGTTVLEGIIAEGDED